MSTSGEPIDPFAGLATEVSTVDPLRLAWFEMSDLGNAERLKARTGGKILHTPERGWTAFDGKHWSFQDGPRRAALAAHGVARALREEADAIAKLKDDEPRWFTGCTAAMLIKKSAELRAFGIQSGNSSKVSGMLAQAEHLMMREDAAFDTDVLALNVGNGTLKFRRKAGDVIDVACEAHDPADLITRVAAVDYDPAARCPKWEAHLQKCLPDPDVREFFQTIIGYTLTGDVSEQVIFMLQGRGGDGKSTAMNVVRKLLGGFASTAKIQSFLLAGPKDGASASPDMARLSGDVRLVSTAEPPKGAVIDDSIIKTITGGQPMVARKLHRDDLEYLPRYKLFIEVNKKPRISGDDDGIWRRIVIILFPNQFKDPGDDGYVPGFERVRGIEDELVKEMPGVLNWAIEGLKRWIIDGQLVQPAAVKEAVEEYRRASNPFGEWMAERCTRDAKASTLSSVLYANYKAWCEENSLGDKEIYSSTKFGIELGELQIMRYKNRAGNIERRGIRLKEAGEVGKPAAPPPAPPVARPGARDPRVADLPPFGQLGGRGRDAADTVRGDGDPGPSVDDFDGYGGSDDD